MEKTKIMSPLIIVGILLSPTLADVSHVLSGAAHPPANPSEVNSLVHKNAFQTGNPQDFWWMASNSPLKQAYDYFKKCSSKGDCLPPVNSISGSSDEDKDAGGADLGPIDVKTNPFLNGAYQGGSVSSSASFSSSGCSVCASGSTGGGVTAFHSGTKIDITNNPFLNGQFAIAGNGEKVRDENGFLGVQPKKPGFATSHPLSNKKPFATSPPLTQQSFVLGGGDLSRGVECRGQGSICVRRSQCINGVVSNADGLRQGQNEVQYCNADTEVCCQLPNSASGTFLPNLSGKISLPSSINGLADVTAGKSSVTGSTLKFSGGAGLSPGQIQVLTDDSVDIKPQVSFAGQSLVGGSNKPVRGILPGSDSGVSATVDYSNVQFDNNVRFSSLIQGPAYLPPIETPSEPHIVTYQPPIPTTTGRTPPAPVLCPAGSFLGPSGTCERPRPNPPCPAGTRTRPDGSCEAPTGPLQCPAGTVLTASGSCEAPTTSTPPCPFGTIRSPSTGACLSPTPKPCPPGTFLTAGGICEAPAPPSTRPPCPPGTIQRLDGSCETPTTPTPIRTTSRAVCPPGTIQRFDGSCESPRPITTTTQRAIPEPCPPGTFLTASGACQSPTTAGCPYGTVQRPDGGCERPTTPRSCPFGTVPTPDGSCARPTPPPTPRPCPPGTFLGISGSCESPKPPAPTACPPGTVQSPSGRCEYPIVTSTPAYQRPTSPSPSPQCPFGTYPTPTGGCETPSGPPTPKPPPRPFETTASRDYLPPVTPTQPSSTSGYFYSTPTPSFEYSPSPTTPQAPPSDKTEEGSSINDQYRLPERSTTTKNPTDNKQESDIQHIVTVSPTRPTPRPPISRQPVTRPPVNRPPFNNNNVEQNNAPPVGCAAALKCVQEIYCTAEGLVSPVPVVLSKEQELLRVPTTECKDLETGIIGKCCRDPNYKDPWPSANLVNGVDDGQYKEDNFYGQRDVLGTNRLTRSSNGSTIERVVIRSIPRDANNGQKTCGERHYDTRPLGSEPLDANFAEYPWQAMILRDSNRSLLCGGAIIRSDAVLTTAHCVEGLPTSDVLIKGGEWKLGIDEEPLPFQIVKVAAILRHPTYVEGSHNNDLAILVLKEKLRLTKNVGTICLPEPNQPPAPKCVVTGWGKRILQLHAKGAIMHHINVSLLDDQSCKQSLQQNFQNAVQSYSPNTFCGVSNVDQCKVDYGSALACSDDQQHYTLQGIYSWDTGCKQEGQIGGFVTPDVEWIDSILATPLKQLKRIEREYLLKSRN